MGIKPDHWIRRMALEEKMIEPFDEKQVGKGQISFGLSSYGYDMRLADEFKIFNNKAAAIIDPKKLDPEAFYDVKGEVCVIPPNSFVLARSLEYFRIPRSIITIAFGKCVASETEVIDAVSGGRVCVADAFYHGGSTATLKGSAVGKAFIAAKARQKMRPVYRLTTRTGRTIRATANHPFLTFAGWKALCMLRSGARIAVPRRIPVFGRAERPPWELTLLGLLISDGQCHTPGHSPRYTSGDPVLRERFSEAVRQFGCIPKTVAKISVNATNLGHRGGTMTKNRVFAWLESLGLDVHSPSKFIPPFVYELKPDSLAFFLQSLFSGDGGISESGGAFHLEYSSTSEKLARAVQHLLLRFGILSILYKRKTDSGRGAYNLSITDKDHIARFARHIGFLPGSMKQKRLKGILEKLKSFPWRRSNFDTLPREAWGLLRRACYSRGYSLRRMGLEGTTPSQSVSRSLALKLARRLGDESLASVADSDILWDVVRDIRFDGHDTVYDLSVPETSNFIANDIIVHNSTYARCGVVANVTPFEPEWEGFVTMGISNTTPLPAKLYAGEGIAQVLFFEADEPCAVSYKDKKGRYQAQKTITLPKVSY